MGASGGAFNMEALAWYCGSLLVGYFAVLGVKAVLLWDSRSSKLSRAADFIPAVDTVASVLAWYCLSVWLTIMIRFMLNDWLGGHFHSAIFLSTSTMAVKWLLTTIAVAWRGEGFPPNSKRSPCSVASQIGALTALDVCLSNLGLLLTDVTFYTLVKTGTLLWTLFWSVILGLETLTARLGLAVSVIVAGLVLSSWGEATLNVWGLICILTASCSSGLRWGLTQRIKQEDSSWSTPLDIIYLIAPASTITMLPFAVFDLYRFINSGYASVEAVWGLLGFALGGGLSATMLLIVEVRLVQLTSSLTMGVFGNLKEVVTILVAIIVLGERATVLEWVGLAVTISGTWAYKGSRSEGKDRANISSSNGYSHVDSNDLALELDALRYRHLDAENYLSDSD